MPSKPLSYEGLKIVLQYMDPNQRLQLSLCAPALRTTERIVPLKIYRLAFGDIDNEKALIINNTKYQLGIYQKYDEPLQTPRFVNSNNARGRSHYERDQYGCVDWDAEKRLAHGDILLSPSQVGDPEELYGDDLDAKIAKMERNSKNCKKYELEVAKYRRDLRNYRRSGASPPYKFYIQLLIKSKRHTQTVRVEYNRPLSDALRHLVTAFFHHRKTHVAVNRLELLSTDMTLRLPVGLKFEIQELTFFNHENTSSALEAITPLLHEKSFPLKSLTVVNTRGSENVPILANVEELVVTKEQLSDIRNLKVHFPNVQLNVHRALGVVGEWLFTEQPVGKVRSFGVLVESEGDLRAFLRSLLSDRLNFVVGFRSFKIPLNNHSKLHISYKFHSCIMDNNETWKMTLEVVPL